MNIYFLLAGGMAGLTMVLHLWLGGREIAAPLLRSGDMHPVAKYTNYYCWHMVSIMLVAMAGGFTWAAYDSAAREVAVLCLILAAAFCFWSLALVVWKRQRFFAMPQWLLFAGITALAIPGM